MRAEESDFTAPRSGRKFVFGTPEYRVLGDGQRGGLSSGAELPDSIDIVTPSRWCVPAYERFGIPAVAHPCRSARHRSGCAPRRCRASGRRARRAAYRGPRAGLSVGRRDDAEQGHRSAPCRFCAPGRHRSRTSGWCSRARTALYPSRDFVNAALDELSAAARDAVIRRMIYTGGTYSWARWPICIALRTSMSAPYRAEGFNLPVLEAAALRACRSSARPAAPPTTSPMRRVADESEAAWIGRA